MGLLSQPSSIHFIFIFLIIIHAYLLFAVLMVQDLDTLISNLHQYSLSVYSLIPILLIGLSGMSTFSFLQIQIKTIFICSLYFLLKFYLFSLDNYSSLLKMKQLHYFKSLKLSFTKGFHQKSKNQAQISTDQDFYQS